MSYGFGSEQKKPSFSQKLGFFSPSTTERQEIDPVFKDALTKNFEGLNLPVQTQVEPFPFVSLKGQG